MATYLLFGIGGQWLLICGPTNGPIMAHNLPNSSLNILKCLRQSRWAKCLFTTISQNCLPCLCSQTYRGQHEHGSVAIRAAQANASPLCCLCMIFNTLMYIDRVVSSTCPRTHSWSNNRSWCCCIFPCLLLVIFLINLSLFTCTFWFGHHFAVSSSAVVNDTWPANLEYLNEHTPDINITAADGNTNKCTFAFTDFLIIWIKFVL